MTITMLPPDVAVTGPRPDPGVGAVYLERFGTFVPPNSLSVHELGERLGLTRTQVMFFTRYLGLDRIAVAGDLGLVEMLTAAGEDALRGLDDEARADIRYVIHAHTIQHVASPVPDLLQQVCARLRLPRASAFGMSHLNCVAGLQATHIARCLLHGADPVDKVLVLTGDRIVADSIRLMPDITLLGEAAAAVLVGRDPRGDLVVGRAIRIRGRFYECLEGSPELWRDYKTTYVEALGEVIGEALRDAGLEGGQIAAVLPHNVNRLSWRKLCREAGIPEERLFLDNVPRTGHCYASDPFLNLAAARAAGRIRPGERVLVTSAGLGAAFAAAVVRVGPGGDR